MNQPGVVVVAPSRVHLGLMSFGRSDVRRFGGVGLMVDRPGIELRLTRADQVSATGPLAERSVRVARQVLDHLGLDDAGCELTVVRAPPEHVGLGSGTQLSLGIAAGLHALYDLPPPTTIDLARFTGRGRRSAIGTYGFERGGLLVEAGKWADDELSPLVAHVALPAEWRMVLVRRTGIVGLSGDSERAAFKDLEPVRLATTEALCRLALLELVPAAIQADAQRFAAAMFDYGRLAGECFAAAQGGSFATPAAGEAIDLARALGFAGAVQTSWGPTVAVLAASASQAEALAAEIQRRSAEWSVVIAPFSTGSSIRRLAADIP